MVKTVQLTSMGTSKAKKRKAAASKKTKTDDPPGTPQEKPVLKKHKPKTSTVEVSFPEEDVARKDEQMNVGNDDDEEEEEEKEEEKESNTTECRRVSQGSDEGDVRGVPKNVFNVGRKQESPASVSSGLSSTNGHFGAKYWKNRYDTLAVEMKSLKEEVAILKKKGGRAGGRAKRVLGAVEQQLVDEAKQAMRVVVRHVKFQKTGWLNYGRKNTQVCDMVMSRISFPPNIGDKELMQCWYKLLAPELPGVLQDLKNKMTQRYRSQYKGEIE